jgi:hypothetical protein
MRLRQVRLQPLDTRGMDIAALKYGTGAGVDQVTQKPAGRAAEVQHPLSIQTEIARHQREQDPRKRCALLEV